jgi:hypothetical protein
MMSMLCVIAVPPQFIYSYALYQQVLAEIVVLQ